jgi:acetyl-CoA C-acetyltransferase
MREVVIVAAKRTAIGKFGGALSSITGADLGAQLIHKLLIKHTISPMKINEVILGQVLTAAAGQNPARQAALRGGLPFGVPAMQVGMVCGSGMKAIHLAAQAIRCGDAEMVIAGGQESMSLSVHALPHARQGFRIGDASLIDTMMFDGLTDAFHHYPMGITAENIAQHYHISRTAQDSYALASQVKAMAAQRAGKFKEEIIGIDIVSKAGQHTVDEDEGIRHDCSMASLERLRPAFSQDGSVTAGNSSTLNDGAAVLILASEAAAKELGLPILARISAYAAAGVDPAMMGMGPVPASKLCLQKAGWKAEDVDLIELNEAFAAQAIAVNQEMGWDSARVNVNGGAIALGHPIGASGARIVVSLLHEMHRRQVHRGLAGLCIGGGMGVALAIECP